MNDDVIYISLMLLLGYDGRHHPVILVILYLFCFFVPYVSFNWVATQEYIPCTQDHPQICCISGHKYFAHTVKCDYICGHTSRNLLLGLWYHFL